MVKFKVKNIAVLWTRQQILLGTTLLRTLKGRAGKIKMRNTSQEAAQVYCHIGLFEGEAMAAFIGKISSILWSRTSK